MLWARYLTPTTTDEGRSGPVSPTPMHDGWGIPVWVAAGVLVVVVLLASYAGVRYFRLAALDDYRTGYAFGLVASQDRQASQAGCDEAMEKLYVGEPSGWTGRQSGWGEFLLGCEDALRAEPAAEWFELRNRFWGTPGFD